MTDAVEFTVSSLLGHVRHGFFGRVGGVSQGRFASLNVSPRWQDDPECVAENLRRVTGSLGGVPSDLVRVRQVHGAAVIAARDVTGDQEADALWHHRDHGGTPLLGIVTADCVPILLADLEGNAVAAIHSGWRGTVADVCGATVRTLEGAGIVPEQLLAAIGPCIEVQSFEVGEEVAQQFSEPFVDRSGPKPHVDLVAAVTAQLLGAGLRAQRVQRVGGCTFSGPQRWFSYRRDGQAGQQISVVGLIP